MKPIIPHKNKIICFFLFLFAIQGCAPKADIFAGKNIYDIYSITKDKRSLYHMAKDRTIITQIQNYILQNTPSKILRIDVESIYGHVYLVGEYESEANKKALLRYVQNLQNVRKITTYLLPSRKVTHCTLNQDIALIARVKAALFQNSNMEATNIHVRVIDCNVVLIGIVDNKVTKLRANTVAKYTPGTRKVVSYLRTLH